MARRAWDAGSYDRISSPMTAMAAPVVGRLPLRGDETVLDAGCGTGRVSELLLERLPRGRVLAVDADPAMVAVARATLAGRAQVLQVDLLELELEEPVDAILSTATFHWIEDHDRLFARLVATLRPGGRLVAQCGGRGNVAAVRAAAVEVGRHPPFATALADWRPPWHDAGPEETARRLEAAGFAEIRTWLEPWPVRPADPEEYLRTILLGSHVQQLPEELRAGFVRAVLDRLDQPLEIGYVRLNMDARSPGTG